MTKKTATLDDLVDQVGNLTSATTNLLNATSTSKATLDKAVDEAKGHAESAGNANTSAVNAREEAKTAASEAKEAEANATAIVHNDEGTTTPTPGAYPVADSKGHLDIGWTPLLAAMYPYSGIMGDINKETTLFFAGSHPSYSNRIDVKSSAPPFNIGGRYVKLQSLGLMLAEAESTAERAIAFDDIFLDWNGTVQTYRSITPHRTTTGYDRDAIATEHGYTKVQTGLYKTGDTYALLLGRVARRNQGAYHPVFNPEGASGFAGKSNPSNHKLWYTTALELAKYPTSLSDCMNKFSDGGSKTHNSNIGKMSAGNSAYWLSPDKKSYDAIFADDFTPLYYSAKNVVDRQALLFDSFNRAVAGETFSGAEGCYEVYKCKSSDTYHQPGGSIYSNGFKALHRHILGSVKATIYRESLAGDYSYVGYVTSTSTSIKNSLGINYGDTGLRGNGFYYIISQVPARNGNSDGSFELIRSSASARPQFMLVDIIGALDAMPDEWKTQGIPGNWLAVGEEGESLIPDGTSKSFKLSRKCLECYQVLKSSDKGAAWADVTSTFKASIEGASNSMGNQSFVATDCYMVFYRTSANPFELSNTGNMLAYEPVVSKFAHYLHTVGSVFGSNLMNKVLNVNYSYLLETLPAMKLSLDRRSGRARFSDHYGDTEHEPVHSHKIEGPTIKTMSFLGNDFHLYIYYKEIKWGDSGKCGDNSKMTFVNKQSTVTDLNGQTVIIGQKRVELPYQFDGVTY